MKIGISQTVSSSSSNNGYVKNNSLQEEFLSSLENAIKSDETKSLDNEINIDNSLKGNSNFELKAELINENNQVFDNNILYGNNDIFRNNQINESNKISVNNEVYESNKIFENNEVDEKLLELVNALFNTISPKINKDININLDNNTQVVEGNFDNNVDNKQEIIEKLDNFVENILDKNNTKENIQFKNTIVGDSLNYYKVKEELSNLIKQNSSMYIEDGYVSDKKINLTFSNDLEIMSNFKALSVKEDKLIIKEQDDFSILNNIVMSKNNVIKEVESKISEPQVVRSQYIAEDFVQTIKYLKSNNIEEINVKMNPKDLGELNIKLIKSNNEEKIIVTLGETDTFNLLKDKINDIKAHLNTLDINVKEIAVEIKNNNENNFSQNLNQQFTKNNNKQKKPGKYISDKSNEITEIKDIIEDDNTNINLLI